MQAKILFNKMIEMRQEYQNALADSDKNIVLISYCTEIPTIILLIFLG